MSAKIWVMAAMSAAASLALAVPSVAADAKGEITIAAQHASLASQATDISGVRMHLHHTLNCLEGPSGADYSKKDMNPCEHAGTGAIPDSTNPTTTATLQSAVGEAVKGLGASDLKTAQGDASATAATLQAIK